MPEDVNPSKSKAKWLWLLLIILLGVVLLLWIFGGADQNDERIEPAATEQSLPPEAGPAQAGGISEAPDALVEASDEEAVDVELPTDVQPSE